MKKYWPKIIILLVGAAILLIAVFPLFNKGFPSNHDRNLYMNWLYEFDQNIRSGNLIPHWAPNVWNGYGSPIFNFVQPGFYYVAEIFHLLGASLIISVKIAIIIAVVLAFVFMYLWSREVWQNSWLALGCATLYVWSPYHLGNMYLRGSFAELLAMAWWPLILFGIVRFVRKNQLKYFYIIALGTAALFLSHNLLTAIFLPVAFVYLLILSWKKWHQLLSAVGAFVLGAGLSAWFWLPALVEKKYLNTELLFSGNKNYANNFLNLKQLIYTEWKDHIYLIGFTGLLVCIITIYFLVEKRKALRISNKQLWFWLSVTIASIFMTSWSSKFIWDAIEPLQFFQFPWRWLSLVSLSFGIMGGIVIMYKRDVQAWTKPYVLSFLLIIVTLFVNYTYATPSGYLEERSDEDYRSFREREIEIKNAIESGETNIKVYFFSEMPEFFSKKTSLASLEKMLEDQINDYTTRLKDDINSKISFPDKLVITEGETEIINQSIEIDDYQFELLVLRDSKVQINTLWFPGWKVYLDSKPIEPDISSDLGLMAFDIAEGEHNLQISYKSSPVRKVGYAISWISILLLPGVALLAKKKKAK